MTQLSEIVTLITVYFKHARKIYHSSQIMHIV